MLDGDLQDPPELIAEFVEKWREGFDVVYGERVSGRRRRRCDSRTRPSTACSPALAYVRVPVDAGDFSLIDRRVVDALNDMPEKHRFVRGLRAGWLPPDGRPVRPPRANVRHHHEQSRRNLGWAGGHRLFLLRTAGLHHRLGASRCRASAVALIVQLILEIVAPDAAPEGSRR